MDDGARAGELCRSTRRGRGRDGAGAPAAGLAVAAGGGRFGGSDDAGGRIALVWNLRDRTSTPFLRGYEALLDAYATEYARLKAGPVDLPVLVEFFAPGGFRTRGFGHEVRHDLAGLQGLLRSTSYAPQPGDPACEPMWVELAAFSTRMRWAAGSGCNT